MLFYFGHVGAYYGRASFGRMVVAAGIGKQTSDFARTEEHDGFHSRSTPWSVILKVKPSPLCKLLIPCLTS